MIEAKGNFFKCSAKEKEIGFTGDNLTETRVFKITDPEYFKYDYVLNVKYYPAGETNVIDLDKVIEDNTCYLTWIIKEKHLKTSDFIEVQLKGMYEDEVWHSNRVTMYIYESINYINEDFPDLPSIFNDILQKIISVKNQVFSIFANIKNIIVKMPLMGENGNWQIWDEETNDYQDSGSPSRGEKGDAYIITEADKEEISNTIYEAYIKEPEEIRAADERERIEQENIRISNEITRSYNEAARQSAEIGRVNTEDNRKSEEEKRINSESERVTSEGNRNNAEASRGTAENTRVASENIRFENEASRKTAENERVIAETNRAAEFEGFEDLINTKQNSPTEITGAASTNIKVSLKANTVYQYGTLSALTINSYEISNYETVIYFTSGETATTFTVPSSLRITDTISILPDKGYAISVRNGILSLIPVIQYNYLQNYDINGSSVLSGEPSPDNPAAINSAGEKEGKLILKSGSTITNIYLTEPLRSVGEAGTSSFVCDDLEYRRIGVKILNGTESVFDYSETIKYINISGKAVNSNKLRLKSTHFLAAEVGELPRIWGHVSSADRVHIGQTGLTAAELKAYFAGQYANGTPVIIYYELAAPIPQNITKPGIPYFVEPVISLNEVQPDITYEV